MRGSSSALQCIKPTKVEPNYFQHTTDIRMDGSVNSQRFYPTRSVCFKDLYWYTELAVFSLAVDKVIASIQCTVHLDLTCRLKLSGFGQGQSKRC